MIEFTSYPPSGTGATSPYVDPPVSVRMGASPGYVQTSFTPNYRPWRPSHYPMSPHVRTYVPPQLSQPSYIRPPITQVRRCVSVGWHVKHAALTMVTGGLWAPMWWVAYRAARRPIAKIENWSRR